MATLVASSELIRQAATRNLQVDRIDKELTGVRVDVEAYNSALVSLWYLRLTRNKPAQLSFEPPHATVGRTWNGRKELTAS